MFFSNGYRAGATETIDQLMENKAIQPAFYDDFLEGAYAAVAESVDNENRLMYAIGINEYAHFAEYGEEYVYTESDIDTIVDKVKSIINKIWEKIKSLFKKFVAMFDRFFASDKDFVKKYRNRIEMAKIEDVEYEGYKFPNLDEGLKVPENENLIEGKDVTTDDEVEKIVNCYRGALIGKSNTEIESGEFSKELEDYLVGDKETMKGSELQIEKQLEYISNYSKEKSKWEKTKKDVDKFFRKAIEALDSKKKEFTKAGKAEGSPFKGDEDREDPTSTEKTSRAARDTVAVFNRKRTILTQNSQSCSIAVGAYLNALKKRNRQARAICVKVMAKGGAFNSKNESTSFEYPAYGSSFLENVKFI